MSFIRHLLHSKLPSRRQRQDQPSDPPSPPLPAHALDTLPTLPRPRRPLTPLPRPRRPITPKPPNPQSQSPFFTLPPELRQIIYRLLLSSHEIHLDLRYTAAETSTPHSTAGASLLPTRTWRWRASTCHRHPDAQPLADRCGWGGPPPTACHLFPGSPCGVPREVLGLMLCCRGVYREVVEVVYGENLFHVGTGAVVLYTERVLVRERAEAVRGLVYRVTEKSVWDYAGEHLGIVGGLGAYGVLLGRLPKAFPGLRRLMVVVEGALARGRVGGSGELRVLDPDEVRVCLLEAMDAVVGAFEGRLVECVVAMGHAAFDRVMEEERAAAERVESKEGMWLQFWRPVSVAQGDNLKAIDIGYWVRRVAPWEKTGSELDFGYAA